MISHFTTFTTSATITITATFTTFRAPHARAPRIRTRKLLGRVYHPPGAPVLIIPTLRLSGTFGY
eukprot:8238557-Pyramimonas_sp.AAC.1